MSNRKFTRAELESGDVTLSFLRANVLNHPVETLAFYHKLGLFRIRAEADTHASFADLCGDCYTPELHPEIDPALIAKQKKAFRSKVAREGVWGFIVEVRRSRDSEWDDCGPTSVDSIWGNVGSDILLSGYDGDLLSTAIEALEKFPPEVTDPTARLVSAATKAMYYLNGMELNGAGYTEWRKHIDLLTKALDAFDPKFRA